MTRNADGDSGGAGSAVGNANGSVAELTSAPLAPRVRLPIWQLPGVLRKFHTGPIKVRESSGPVAVIRFGPRWLVPRVAFITSPRGARDTLAGSPESIDKRGLVTTEMLRQLGPVLVTMPHRTWLPRRRALQPLFTKKHVATFAAHLAEAAEETAARWSLGSSVDLNHECRRLMLRMLGRSLFDLELEHEAADIEAHDRAMFRYIMRRFTRPVRAPTWLPTPARARYRRHLAGLHQVVQRAIAEFRNNPASGAELIRLLADTPDPTTGRPFTDQVIRDELTEFLVGGHDTTSTTLAYALWQLGHHPDLQNRVAAEVTSTVGDRSVHVDDIANLPYTVQTIHESLRMCPPAAAISRRAMTDVVIDGFRVERGAELVVGTYALHKDPALWKNPERFDPDRFGPDRASERDRWQFLPFAAGPRRCIGDHFSMLEATLALATVIRSTEVTSSDPEFPLALPFFMAAAGPINATVRARRRR